MPTCAPLILLKPLPSPAKAVADSALELQRGSWRGGADAHVAAGRYHHALVSVVHVKIKRISADGSKPPAARIQIGAQGSRAVGVPDSKVGAFHREHG